MAPVRRCGNLGQMAVAMGKRIYLGMETNGAKGGGQDTKAMRVWALNATNDLDGMKVDLAIGGKSDTDAARNARKRDATARPLRLLASYFYYKDEDIKAIVDTFGGRPVELFADSGAYSAHSLGEDVKEADYIAWVKKWGRFFECVSAPDVIGDPEETYKATVRMRRQITSVQVLPVFHVGEDWNYLTRWIGKADYLALGGMVPYSRNKPLLTSWIRKAFKLLPPKMRVHGFGMTTWSLLKAFPWYSVDSSSWTASFRYAQLQLFDRDRGRFVTLAMNKREELLRAAPLLRSYGLDASQARAHNFDRTTICGVAVESWQRAETWLSQRRGGGPHISLVTRANNGVNDAQSISKAIWPGGGPRTYLCTEAAPSVPNSPHSIKTAMDRRAGK